jgi:alpha-glucosidase
MTRVLLIATISLLSMHVKSQDSLTLSSPDGKIVFSCALNERGELSYKVSYGKQPVILKSALGVDGWSESFVLKRSERRQQNTTWKPVYGERAVVKDNYREANFIFWRQNQQGNQMNLQVRAYDEGVAFRYVFPAGINVGSISKEYTRFVMPSGTEAWFTDHAQGIYKLLPLKAWPL